MNMLAVHPALIFGVVLGLAAFLGIWIAVKRSSGMSGLRDGDDGPDEATLSDETAAEDES